MKNHSIKFFSIILIFGLGLLPNDIFSNSSANSSNIPKGEKANRGFKIIRIDPEFTVSAHTHYPSSSPFALASDGGLFVIADDPKNKKVISDSEKNQSRGKDPEEKLSDAIIKLDSKGQLIWCKELNGRSGIDIAARHNGGAIISFSNADFSHVKIENYILFLDKNGDSEARWDCPGTTFFCVKAASNGNALFLCGGWIGCIDDSGSKKWILDSYRTMDPYFLSISPHGFVSTLMLNTQRDRGSALILGGGVNSDKAPKLKSFPIFPTDQPVAMSSSLEKNGLIYVVFEEKGEMNQGIQEFIYRIDSFDFLNKQETKAQTIARLKADEIIFKGKRLSNIWRPLINCKLISLPAGKLALLDGWQRTRLTLFDSSGKILSQHEYKGKGSSIGDLIAYDAQTNIIHIAGRTGKKDETFHWYLRFLHEPFWIKLSLND